MIRQDAPTIDSALETPYRELLELSAEFSQAFIRWLDGSTSGGLTFPRLRVLELLHCQGPAKMKSLADGLGLSARNLTAVADCLEAEGLIRRVAHPTDRRATLLELTDAGQSAADESLAPRLAEIGDLFDELSPTARAAFKHSLSTLITAMRAKQSELHDA